MPFPRSSDRGRIEAGLSPERLLRSAGYLIPRQVGTLKRMPVPASPPEYCPRGLFITGTDTDVGKTYVAARIAESLVSAGHRVGVYKPVASGSRIEQGRCISTDAEILWLAAGRPRTLEQVCPQCFAAPLAPHLAAAAEAKRVDSGLLRSGLAAWSDSDVIVVEGVGGLLSPITADEYVADLAEDFGFPLVVVAADCLGTIHQTLATLVAAATFRQGLDVAGIVLNRRPEDAHDPSTESNAAELRARSVPPLLTRVEPGGSFISSVDWFELAKARRA